MGALDAQMLRGFFPFTKPTENSRIWLSLDDRDSNDAPREGTPRERINEGGNMKK